MLVENRGVFGGSYHRVHYINKEIWIIVMTQEEIKNYLALGEGIRIEFKEASRSVPSDLYETVVSFSNKDGGVILLGVSDDGIVRGVDPECIFEMKQNITTACNNSELINPPISLTPIQIECDGKEILALKIPTSSQVHKLNNTICDRENDSDIRITDQSRISDIYFRKRTIFTETQIYPAVTEDDLKTELFDKARTIIRAADPAHPWLALDNIGLMRSATLFCKDFKTGEEGVSLAGVLLFGKDETIQSILPAYKIEALVRRDDLDRWDDRLTLRTNLIDSYFQLMDFVRKHLSSKFYMEGDQRKDLRDIIFRELIGNILCHREYTSSYSTDFIIYKDKVVATNPNKPLFHGPLDVHAFSPFAKNPNIRKFFSALSWADEIGSGVRNMTKYLPRYVSGGLPSFLEDEVFRTEVPLIVHTWKPYAEQFISLFNEISPQVRERIKANIQDLPIAVDEADTADFDTILIKKVSSWGEKGAKLPNSRVLINKGVTKDDLKKVSSWSEKGAKLFPKRTDYILKILLLTLASIPLVQLMESIGYNNRQKFRELYLLPLIEDGLIGYTIPDKPTSEKQQYVITEKGKLFLGGFEI